MQSDSRTDKLDDATNTDRTQIDVKAERMATPNQRTRP